MAARVLVKQTEDSAEREAISIKYQVLAPETAFVGVVKEDGIIVPEVIEIAQPEPVPEPVVQEFDQVAYAQPNYRVSKGSNSFGSRPMAMVKPRIMYKTQTFSTATMAPAPVYEMIEESVEWEEEEPDMMDGIEEDMMYEEEEEEEEEMMDDAFGGGPPMVNIVVDGAMPSMVEPSD